MGVALRELRFALASRVFLRLFCQHYSLLSRSQDGQAGVEAEAGGRWWVFAWHSIVHVALHL